MRLKIPYGCLPLTLFAALLILLPLFLADVMLTALARLGLSPQTSALAALGIFAGGMINIPVKKIPRENYLDPSPHGLFGVDRFFSHRLPRRQYTIIAVNFGGCIVPCMIVVYELVRIATHGPVAFFMATAAIGINIAVCYRLAQPIANVGIAMPALVPAFVAAICGILFFREIAPLIAFSAGVLGPLVGADLMHLKEIERINTSVASIGGAGTFDGIVLSGLIATLLA
ncbi:MAG: DUF1614 domain-containing protein [Thermodesulfobacteriota bacterium]